MKQEELERFEYMAQSAKEAGIMLVIAPEAVLSLVANNQELRAFSADALVKAANALAEADGLQGEIELLKDKNKKLNTLLKGLAGYLSSPWFNDWPTAQAKLSEVEAAIANLKEEG